MVECGAKEESGKKSRGKRGEGERRLALTPVPAPR